MKHEIWCPLEDMKKEGLWYAIVTRDRHGEIVSRERRKSYSFLQQWNQLTYARIAGSWVGTVHATNGASHTLTSDVVDFKMNAAAGVTIIGIRVGTGNTAVDIEDYSLETPIVQGVGADQMDHLVCTVDVSVVAAPSCSFALHRTIANSSGGVITVREAAIYMQGGGTYYFCGVRDVLTVPQAVPDGGAITIDWTIGVTE